MAEVTRITLPTLSLTFRSSDKVLIDGIKGSYEGTRVVAEPHDHYEEGDLPPRAHDAVCHTTLGKARRGLTCQVMHDFTGGLGDVL